MLQGDHSLKADKQHAHSKSSVHKTSTVFSNDRNAPCFSGPLSFVSLAFKHCVFL